MKNNTNQDLEDKTNKPNITLNEESHPTKQITHYFSVPETPYIKNHPNGRNTHPEIPESPEQIETETRIFESPSSRNDQSLNRTNLTDPLNINMSTQDDAIILELMNTTKTQPSNHE